MHTYSVSRWALPGGGLLLAAGTATVWAGLAWEDPLIGAVLTLLGVIVGAMGVVMLAVLAASRAHRSQDDRKFARYGCDRCGYVPRPEDMEQGESFPCPTCGRPLYPE